jgi:riboflavin biosynthesis pyrimidine reductase
MLMRRLHPAGTAEVNALDEYAVPGTGRHLRVNMVAGVDGAAAVGGRVGLLSGTADQVLLHELRTLCDVLLVGAGTIRAEGYGPIRLSDEQQQARRDRDQVPVPRLAVLSRSLDLDFAAPVFTRATARPLVLTTAGAPGHRRADAAQVADVVVADDLAGALHQLTDAGLARILSEGGPHVLNQLYAADLVDELCLAIAPVVTGGQDLRITAGPPMVPPRMQRLAAVSEREGFLFLRYTRAG